MTLDLAALRAMRKSSSSTLSKISSELQKQEQSGGRKEDDRFWKATVDKAGNGSAIIRFLPARDDDDLPWVKAYDKGFQGPTGKWYIENCLTTIGQSDPVVEHCNALWAGTEEDKAMARKMKRRLSYYANVLIIKDPANPENEGKVKLFKFGKKIFDKLKDKLDPQFEDEDKVDIFSPYEGANFRLRIAKVDGYSNTDKSVFDSPSELADGDEEEMLRILNERHHLAEFLAPSRFKSYDELKKKFEAVMSGSNSASQKKAAEFMMDEEEEVKPQPKAKVREEPTQKVVKSAPVSDDDDMAFFRDLIED